MAEVAPESEIPKKDVKVEAPDIESQIQSAMRSRVAHFKEQADSLTFEGVRRLLEKDLGLEAYALDVHKRFVKQCLLKILEGVGEDQAQKSSGEVGENRTSTQETEGSTEECHSKKDVKDRCPKDEEKMEDSPVLGLFKEQKQVKLEKKEAEGNGEKVVPSETIIKKAIRKRASYIKANSEKVTMVGLRRLLEEDLKLDKFTLDPYKKFISQQLDEVLKSFENSKPTNNAKKTIKDKPNTKATKKVSSEESSDTSDQDSDEEEKGEDEVKHRKRSVPKGKMLNSAGLKKRKGPREEKTNLSSKKRIKPAKAASEDNSETENGGKNSEDDQSSPEKPTKKKEVPAPAYGKRVEHIRSVIKACGMSVPPSIYRKAKQLPESKREAQLIKDLEEILSREGLSSNPSEKEIKEVRRKKERAKELEGIDVSNIVLSSRRRSTTGFAPPPKPKIPVETNGEDAEDSDDDNDDEDNDDEGDDDKEDEEDDENEDNSDDDDDGSQSEEFNEDEEDSD